MVARLSLITLQFSIALFLNVHLTPIPSMLSPAWEYTPEEVHCGTTGPIYVESRLCFTLILLELCQTRFYTSQRGKEVVTSSRDTNERSIPK